MQTRLILSAMNRVHTPAKTFICGLPPHLKSLCNTGCIYRESPFRHLGCQEARKTECAAPCRPEPCPCYPSKTKVCLPTKVCLQ
jgi:hypothetical protein